MKHHPLFDTPQGQGQLDAMYSAVHSLNKLTDPITTADVYRDFRQARFIEPGLEGLTGAAATYHLTDTAGYVVNAAQVMTGTFHVQGLKPKEFPRAALNILGEGFGYRYERGVRGLHDALVVARIPALSIAEFDARRAEFSELFQEHLRAAFLVNAAGECPAAAVKAIRMFAIELVTLGTWLERSGEGGRAGLIKSQMHDVGHTLDVLDAQNAQPKKRKK